LNPRFVNPVKMSFGDFQLQTLICIRESATQFKIKIELRINCLDSPHPSICGEGTMSEKSFKNAPSK
jgi:hypothetical protein